MKRIYLDNGATTPVKNEVMCAMAPYFRKVYGNPSSIHGFGRDAKKAIENSREKIAKMLGVESEEIVFTSGGTESDNLAIKGIIDASKMEKPHIITSAFEHHAVLDTCKDLEKRALAEVSYIKPDKQGVINPDDIKKAVKNNTILVSVMYVNNEIGTIQPIEEITKIVLRNKRKIYFHSDAVQAVEYQDMRLNRLGVDLLSVSAHKFGGPKGVGLIYVKKGIKIHHENIGGAQEFGLRAGTENIAGIVGMRKAFELAETNKQKNIAKTTKLRDYFIDRILQEIPDTRLNGSRKFRSPNNINISFKFVEGEAILLYLDQAGIAASSGSACTSGSLEPSHVLLSMGMKHEDAHGSIRFTISERNTKNEIDFVVEVLKKSVKKLREFSPYKK